MNLLRITRIGIKFVQLLFIPFVSSFTQINNRYKMTNLRLNDWNYVWKETISWLNERNVSYIMNDFLHSNLMNPALKYCNFETTIVFYIWTEDKWIQAFSACSVKTNKHVKNLLQTNVAN